MPIKVLLVVGSRVFVRLPRYNHKSGVLGRGYMQCGSGYTQGVCSANELVPRKSVDISGVVISRCDCTAASEICRTRTGSCNIGSDAIMRHGENVHFCSEASKQAAAELYVQRTSMRVRFGVATQDAKAAEKAAKKAKAAAKEVERKAQENAGPTDKKKKAKEEADAKKVCSLAVCHQWFTSGKAHLAS